MSQRGAISWTCLGVRPLVLAVVPLQKVRVHDSLFAQSRQCAGLSRSLHRAAKNKRKWLVGEYGPYPLRKLASIIGQSEVRRAGMLAAEAPRRLPVSDRVHVHVRSPSAGSDVIGLGRGGRRGTCLLAPAPAGDLGHIVPIPGDVLLVIDELVPDSLLGVSGPRSELRHAIDHVTHEVESIE